MTVRAKKSLGQNFLIDKNIIRKIVATAGDISDCTVIEIGIGTGNLTNALLSTDVKSVIGVEKDSRFIENVKHDKFSVIEADALEVDLSQLADGKKKVVANLPYNISTTLLINWMEYAEAFESFTLMFQKEVADRIVADTRTKSYGRLSVLVQSLCSAKREFDIPPQAFRPQPKIMSSVVTITPNNSRTKREEFFKPLKIITKAAFGQRRKMLRSSLKALDCEHLTCTHLELLKQVGIPETARAEEISVEKFCELAKAYNKCIKTS